MQTTEVADEATEQKASTPQTEQAEPAEPAGWWQRFWHRYSPHGEFLLSWAGSWGMHIFVLVLLMLLTSYMATRHREQPGVDVVALGNETAGASGGGDDGVAPGERPGVADAQVEVQPIAASAAKSELQDTKLDLPDVPPPPTPPQVGKNLVDRTAGQKQMEETDAALRDASDMLRKILETNQNRGNPGGTGTGTTGAGPGSGGPGKGDRGFGTGRIDANSTAGRQARWVISYPTIPQNEYEHMLDSFGIELAYLMADRRTLQYAKNLAGAAKKHTGNAEDEDRMFWYWMGRNHLRELDDAILRRHGLEPTSDVVHLYPKDLEKKLADMERDYLQRNFKTKDVERISETDYRIVTTGTNGWRLEVTRIILK